MSTAPETALEILDKFLNTPFKSPCPASNFEAWPDNVQLFLDDSVAEMSKIGNKQSFSDMNGISNDSSCAICELAEGCEFTPVGIMPGGVIKIVRENPTSAIVRFAGRSIEPAHHHTYGHDVLVIKGKKIVWNLSKGGRFELGVGDYLFTPGGDVHRVKYLEDTEIFIRWDAGWDIELDEDLATAIASLEKEA